MPEVFYSSVVFNDTIYTGGERYPGYGQARIRKMIYSAGNWQLEEVWDNTGPVNGMYADDNCIFVAFSNDGYNPEVAGFTYSTDGQTWNKYNAGLPKDSIFMQFGIFYVYNLFTVSANHQYVFVGTRDGVYRSPRPDFIWEATNAGLPSKARVNAMVCKENMLIIAIGNKLYKSENSGSSWVENYIFSGGNAINRISCINDTLFVLTQTQGMSLSSDWGISWSSANIGLDNEQAFCLANLGSTYFLGHGTGISKGLNAWENTNNNMVCSNVRDMDQTGSVMAAVETDQVFISPDEGLTWDKRTPFELTGHMNSIVTVNGCLFFSLNPGYPYSECLNYRSCDNGDSWFLVAPLPNYGDSYVLRSNGNKIAAYVDAKMFLSSDNGDSWTAISPPPGLGGDLSDVLFSGNDLYATVNYTSKVLRSADFGQTWNFCNDGLNGHHIYGFGEAPGTVFAISPTSLFKSFDQGQTWMECAPLGEDVQDFTSTGQLIFACTETQVYFSRDMGVSWIDISYGLPPLPNLWGGTLMVRDDYLYFGTFTFGIWKIHISDLPSVVSERAAERAFEICPNPANNELNIVSLNYQQISHVEIFDLSGRMVYKRKGPGNIIETGFLNPGLYLVKIETNDSKRYHEKFLKL